MNSHKSPVLDSVDLLIAGALQAQVDGVEPSPHVWERIRRRAQACLAHRRPPAMQRWNASLIPASYADLSVPLPVVVRNGLVTWRCEQYERGALQFLAALQFLDYAGMMLRFGW